MSKLFLGPARTMPCAHCGERLGVPTLMTVAILVPTVIALAFALGGALPWPLALGVVLLDAFAFVALVPLGRRG